MEYQALNNTGLKYPPNILGWLWTTEQSDILELIQYNCTEIKYDHLEKTWNDYSQMCI